MMHRWRGSRSGFTLVEMMVVVLIISVLIGIAWPNWKRARESARTRSCVSNLSNIAAAKEHYAMAKNARNGETVEMSDLVPDFLRSQPECPANGTYTVGVVGEDPTCDYTGHELH